MDNSQDKRVRIGEENAEEDIMETVNVEADTVTIIKTGRLHWIFHVERMMVLGLEE